MFILYDMQLTKNCKVSFDAFFFFYLKNACPDPDTDRLGNTDPDQHEISNPDQVDPDRHPHLMDPL